MGTGVQTLRSAFLFSQGGADMPARTALLLLAPCLIGLLSPSAHHTRAVEPGGTADEMKKLQGRWTIASWESDGKSATAESLRGIELVVSGHGMTMPMLGGTGWVFRLDPTQT